ncbi:MAG TPA: hypothetical protein PKC29_07700 [Thermodesulfobacteriota bacterium]|nr:hypothetical protein [Thermodesulfobacteriota bacterium]
MEDRHDTQIANANTNADESSGRLSPALTAALLFLTGAVVYYWSQPKTVNPFNYFEYLADAILHGRLDIKGAPFYFEELVRSGDKSYIIYPPIPAVLLLPVVAITGIWANQLFLSFLLGGLNVSLVYLTFRRLTDDVELPVWMAVLLGFGTIHWYTASIGSAWYLAQITSFFFLMLAVYFAAARPVPLASGLALGASYLSRLTTILCFPFFAVMLYGQSGRTGLFERLRPVLPFSAGAAIFVLVNFVYNYVRFGSPFDVAYTLHTISAAKEKVSPWFDQGLFSLSYVKYHLYTFLLEPPYFMDKWPYVVPSMTGLSVFITTPAFLLVPFAGVKRRLALASWAAIIPTAFLIFIKSGTGWTQFGYRYALDFYPFLLMLTFLGTGGRLRWYHKALIILSVLVNLWGVLFINKFEWYKLY